MTANHEIVWTFDCDQVVAEASCTAPNEAACRHLPRCMCEEFDIQQDDAGYYHMVEDERHDHFPIEYCNILEWLNADSPLECADPAVRRYTLARSPVDVSWHDGYYIWRPA